MKDTKIIKLSSVTLPRRLGAILYDFLLLLGLLIIASALVVIPFDITPEKQTFIIYQIYIFVLTYIYYVWFWVRSGQTLGMQTWKVKITTVDGSSITISKASIRFFVALISISVFGLGFIWSIFDKNNRTWHDIASSTQLIRV